MTKNRVRETKWPLNKVVVVALVKHLPLSLEMPARTLLKEGLKKPVGANRHFC
jgi:hypothetical protein